MKHESTRHSSAMLLGGMGPVNAPVTAAGVFLKDLVQSYHEQKVFNIILTPDYNDAHANHVHLEVRPRGEPSFVCLSPHGGALEFLRRTPDPGRAVV